MDELSFDRLTLLLSRLISRRATIRGLSASGVAVRLGWSAFNTDARKKRRKRKKKKIKRNDFGCVNVGNVCKNNGQCCSGICNGKKGKKKCKAHDTGGCQGDTDVCAGTVVPCVTGASENGACVRTTGNAGYCQISSVCFPCTKDTDCESICGPQAACIVCELECGPNGTACVGPGETSCVLME